MATFSQRKGLKPVRQTVQRESMDNELRNGLWNVMSILYWSPDESRWRAEWKRIKSVFCDIWVLHLREVIDDRPLDAVGRYTYMREHFFGCSWNEAFDLLEFIAGHVDSAQAARFMDMCNNVLERDMSAYRFVGPQIVEVTDQHEIETIEAALARSPEAVRTHLETALQFLSDRKSPDYRNSVKESISAVESLCRRIAGSTTASLGEALTRIDDRIPIHGALKAGFSKLYGYTSDEEGIRHALLEESAVSATDAKFMLSACAAFVNYLLGKLADGAMN